jgi:hypothetical protein
VHVIEANRPQSRPIGGGEGAIREKYRDPILWSTLPQYLSSGVIEDHVFCPELRINDLDNL